MALALVVALMATLLGGLPGAGGAGAAPAPASEALTRVVVQAQRDIGAAAAAVADQGGRVLEVLAPFGIVIADVPADTVATIEADAATTSVTEDFPLRVQSADGKDVGKAKGHAAATANVSGDPEDGAGVGIVVVDTGIAEHDDLEGRVTARYDLATGKGKKDASFDPHGHGTFLAGLAAGSGASSDGAYTGAAPAAHLVSVRVAEPDGSTTLARVLHGLAVADAARTEHDAPVVLLALAGPTGDVPDPIMMVLEMLWSRGSTVVVAAGNQGDELTSPGADPYLLTVGAYGDVNDTPDDPTDDTVPAWSSRGEKWNTTKPDLVAPGVSMVGLRSAGSTIDVDNPDARVDDHYFIGSGTSMAAAWTAGAAAAVLANSPAETSPDEVKGRLMGTATTLPDVDGAGAGVLNLDDALDADDEWTVANTELPPLPAAVNPSQTHARVTAPGQLRRTANGIAPAAWTWTAWTWTAWTWTGWEWTTPENADLEGELAAWTWTDDEWAAWTWTEDEWGAWTWTAWTWTDAEWAAWTWTAWTWTAWTWTAHDWGAPGS